MLGVVSLAGPGASDALLTRAARDLAAAGWRLAGAVQHNPVGASGGPCAMELRLLGSDTVLRISQDLGPASRGCRLDPAGLAAAAGIVERALDAAPGPVSDPVAGPVPDLVIINKFGKQEVDGGGFRPLIGRALAAGIPVLTTVGAGNRAGFDAFADGLAEEIAPTTAAIRAWAESRIARSPAAR